MTLADSATITNLRQAISQETGLASFIIKTGFPPRVLDLDSQPPTTNLNNLDVKLNGEQLIIDERITDTATSRETTAEISQRTTDKPTPAKDLQSIVKAFPDTKDGTFESFSFTRPASKSAKQSRTPASRPQAAPLSLSRKRQEDKMKDVPEIALPELGGTLVLRIMPDDNSCLFRAIAAAVMPDLDAMNELRSVIAQTIQADPDTYNRAVLDNKDPTDYCYWIQSEDAWGGQVELQILSKQFDVEICSIDVETLRVDRYNQGMSTRCIVVYSGIHYDTIALSPFGESPESDVKIFDTSSDEILRQAVALCQQLKDQHYFTNTAAMTLRCGDCGSACIGETGAQEHAAMTGHYNFGEG